MTETELRKPGRPRSVQADQAILDAALELIAQEGIQGMSIEGVAARAGVGKTTIYRRWPNKDALALDALRTVKPPILSFDTGNLRSDIVRFMTFLRDLLDDPLVQRVALRVLGELAGRPDWPKDYFMGAMSSNYTGLYGMIERARDRGELRADIDIPLVMEMIGGPVFYHFIFTLFLPNQPPFNIDQCVELLWNGLTPYRADTAASS